MTGWYLGIALFLLLANGLFVGAEFAVIAVRRSRVEQLAAAGDRRARIAAKSLEELSLMLAGAQLGITMCSLGLGFVAEPAIAHLIESGIASIGELPETALHAISFAIALTIVTFLHMVIGEMAPKNIAIAEPERSVLWLILPFRFFVTIFRPLVNMLNVLANGGLRLMGIEPRDAVSTAHTAEEIGAMIEESARGGMLKEFEHSLLRGAIGIRDRDAGSAMIPRTEIAAVPITSTPTEIEQIILQTGHTRIPIFAADVDHIVGFFHAMDLLEVEPEERDRPIARKFIHQMLIVPESRKLHPLLADMRRERRHFALVVDEHGGTAGILTIEDVVEELVGEIRDEYDVAELGIERLSGDRFIVPGTLRIDEAAQRVGVDLPEGDYETIAGFVMDRLGRIPKRRDVVEHLADLDRLPLDGFRFTAVPPRIVKGASFPVRAFAEIPGD